MTIAICPLICFSTLLAYVVNNIDPDQTPYEQSDQGS